jgi:hypothetical protein
VLTPVGLERGGGGEEAKSQIAVFGRDEEAVCELPMGENWSVNVTGHGMTRAVHTISPQKPRRPRNTIRPLRLVLSAMIPHTIEVRIINQAPMDIMALALSRSNPNETTSNGA